MISTNNNFWECVSLRYGWRLTNIPSTCSCGSKMDIQHAMSCKKGGFITIRHNDLRDLTANLLTEVCKGVNTEPTIYKRQYTGVNIQTTPTCKR